MIAQIDCPAAVSCSPFELGKTGAVLYGMAPFMYGFGRTPAVSSAVFPSFNSSRKKTGNTSVTCRYGKKDSPAWMAAPTSSQVERVKLSRRACIICVSLVE